MRALTIKRPWAQAIVYGSKRIENRSRRAPAKFVGERVAIHAGKGVDQKAFRYCRRLGFSTTESQCESGIIGVATLVEVVEDSFDPWFMGPFGLVFDDVLALERAIPCRGQLGFWRIPQDVKAEVERLALLPSWRSDAAPGALAATPGYAATSHDDGPD